MEPGMEVYARRLVRGSAVVFTCMVAAALVAFLLRMFLARELPVEEYGLFYALLTLVSFFNLFRDLGLNSALVKFLPEFRAKGEKRALRSSLSLVALLQTLPSLLLLSLLFLLSGWLSSSFFRNPGALLPLRILLLWFFFNTFYQLFRAAFQGLQDMLAYSLADLLWILLILLLSLVTVGVLGRGVEGVALAYLLSTCLVAGAELGYLRLRYPEVLGRPRREEAGRLLSFALPVLVGMLGGLVLGYTDTLMLTVFKGAGEVGLYQAAQPLAGLVGYFVGALTVVLFPMVSEMWAEGRRKEVAGALSLLLRFSLAAVLPLALVLLAFPEVAVRLVFGQGYLGGVDALRILSCNAVVYTLFAILGAAVAGVGRPFLATKAVGFMAVFNFLSNFLLIPPFGAAGAALTTLLSTLLGVLLLLRYSRGTLGLSLGPGPLLKMVVGGILTLLLISGLKWILRLPPWPEAFVVLVPGLLLYGLWLLATSCLTREELEFLSRVVPLPMRRAKG